MASVFNQTGALRPNRSAFNLSESTKMDVNVGMLYPVFFREMYPGDKFKFGAQAIVRLMSLINPSFIGLNFKVELFFMPTRLLMGSEFDKYFRTLKEDHGAEGNWEEFINGGEDGESTVTLPRWNPTNNAKYSLWDYFGFPVGVKGNPNPLDFPRRMYNAVWNEYYRNENVESEVASTNESVLPRNWKRDYFTSALPFQQRGISPALPVSILGSASLNLPFSSDVVFSGQTFVKGNDSGSKLPSSGIGSSGSGLGVLVPNLYQADGSSQGFVTGSVSGTVSGSVSGSSFSTATFDVADMREAFQIQKWMERNSRGGVRYTEFLRAHFGVSPKDYRLDRPQYIGSITNPIIISEVLQTSSSDTTSPQGNLAGHGLGAGGGYIGSFYAEEYGYLMALFSSVPQRAEYFQGFPREMLRETRYDFYSPEFAHLSEQEVRQDEIYASDDAVQNATVFGFQGAYNELRCGRDKVCGSFRDSLLNWSFARQFSAAPQLNSSFAQYDPTTFNRIFAVQTDEGQPVPNILVNFSAIVKAIRPMPYLAEPGLVDHF